MKGNDNNEVCEGSKMICTFVGSGMRENVTSMHRFFVSGEEQIEDLLGRHGWRCEAIRTVGSLCDQRPVVEEFASSLILDMAVIGSGCAALDPCCFMLSLMHVTKGSSELPEFVQL